jgi:hypothetical protein
LYLLRAFPFSFSILWRYALVLPILLLVLIVYGLMAAIMAFVLGFVSPAFAVLVAISFGLASSVIPAMVGTRLGLQARGLKPRISYLGLMVPAIGYGLFEGFCVLMVLAVSLGAIIVSTPLSVPEMLQLGAVGDEVLFARLLEVNAPITLAVTAVAGFWIIAIRTALLVPFAGASVGMDPDGRAHTPFYGFGRGFWSILILVIISYLGTALIPLILIGIAPLLGFGEVITAATGQIAQIETRGGYTRLGVETLILFCLWLFMVLWFFSLQCAGAALVFLRHKERFDLERRDINDSLDEQLSEPPMPKTDMRALVRSRMPQRRY